MKAEQSHGLIKGALLLTLAGFIGKILSAGYRIPLQNLTGDAGFYMYQQVYPFLGIAMMLGLYGFPSAVSKLAAEHEDSQQTSSCGFFYGRIWLVLTLINALFFLLLYIGADQLAQISGDPELASGYRMTAYVFLLIPFTALLRGILQAQGDMQATAYSQVTEQFVRAVIIMFGAYIIAVKGTDLYVITHIGALAQIAGAVLAVCVLALFWRKKKPAYKGQSSKQTVSWLHMVQVICGFGLLAGFNHMILIIIQAVDMLSLVPQLQSYGLTQREAMVSKGVLDRGQPLVQLGTVLGSSFALALVPTITKQGLKQGGETVRKSIRSALSFSFYLAGGATIGLVMIFPETNTLLYENADGTGALRILSVALLLSSVAITGVSILQSTGHIKWTAVLIVSSGFIKWVGNILFVPLWGLTGSAVATIAALALLTTAVLILIYVKLPGFGYKGAISWPAFITAGLSMAVSLELVKLLVPFTLITSRLILVVYVTGIVALGAAIYISVLIKLGALDDDDISMLPFASQLMKLRKG